MTSASPSGPEGGAGRVPDGRDRHRRVAGRVLRDLTGIGASLAALLVRQVVDGMLPTGLPYLTFFPAVFLTTFFCGLRAGVICAVLSGLMAWYFVIPPFHGFVLSGSVALALGFYAFVATVGIALIHRLQRTTDRLRDSERQLRDLSTTLEEQVARRTATLETASAWQAAILGHAAYAVIATDPDGTITLFNPAAERMLGYAAEELVGQATPAIFHDASQVASRAAALSSELGRVVPPGFAVIVSRSERGLPNSDEWTYVSKAGRRIPVLLDISMLKAGDGSRSGFLGIALDLTERHTHEAELKAAKAGTWSYDVASGRVRLSAESARQHGLGDAPVEIDVETEWRPLAHPDDVPGTLSALEAAIATCGSYRTEFRILQPDGGTRWITAIGRVEVDLPGTAARVVGLTLDVTAQMEAEQALRDSERRFRLLADNTTDLIVRIDRDAIRRYVSPASRTILGYEPQELVGTTWCEAIHPDDQARGRDLIAGLLSGRENKVVLRQRYRHRNGRYVWIEASCQPLRDESGEPAGCIASLRDISEQQAKSDALRQAKRAAEEASQAKTDFLAAMSHEIRTPLNAIIGFTELMVASRTLAPEQQRQAELVRASGDALLTVVNDILDFSKVEAGAIELERRPFPVRALVDDCTAIVRSLASRKDLELRTVIDPGLSRGYLGDQGRLRQILLNLLNNAVKFTKAGSIALAVRREASSASGDQLRFCVTDTGHGIPRERQHRLFQRFSQADSSIQRDFGGTGLGLAICKRLVELMDGAIGVVSEDGQGSTFWFTLVLPRAVLAEPDGAVAGVPATRKRGRLLLVEDVEVNQELARIVLEKAGHSVDIVDEGEAAVIAVDQGRYDLVLMDVQMPGMDGLTATRLIRRLGSSVATVPIIAMTANVLPDQVRRFREAGMDDHVGKPFDRAELYATIERWLPDACPAPAAEAAPRDPSFDRARHDGLVAMLAPPRVAELLTVLIRNMEMAFAEPASTIDDRTRLRRDAHMLASAAGMIGYTQLAQACRSLEALTEAAITGPEAGDFDACLKDIRRLCAEAARHARRLIAAPDVRTSRNA